MASVSIRYARAFADVVLDLKLDVSKVCGEVRSMVEIVTGSIELQHVWENPAVTHEEKLRLLDAIVARAGFERAVRDFMAVILEHGRIRMLAAIARRFEFELNQRMGFVEADVRSARELSAQEKAALETQIAAVTGRKVRARYAMDGSIIGGAMVQVGSTIYDGSLRGQLQRMREQLAR
jgi:F-type H+-transporting ATPase subunit delta